MTPQKGATTVACGRKRAERLAGRVEPFIRVALSETGVILQPLNRPVPVVRSILVSPPRLRGSASHLTKA
jgi:hypothetical protein